MRSIFFILVFETVIGGKHLRKVLKKFFANVFLGGITLNQYGVSSPILFQLNAVYIYDK